MRYATLLFTVGEGALWLLTVAGGAPFAVSVRGIRGCRDNGGGN